MLDAALEIEVADYLKRFRDVRDERGWRGLVRGGPAAVITTLGVLRFDAETHEAYLASYHPGTTPQEVQTQTGWPLRVAPDIAETPPPAIAELAEMRRLDPDGHWTS